MATWPATLPAPLLAGYGIQPNDQTIRTDMEVGSPRVRRRTAARRDEYPISANLSDAQMAIFRAWFETEVAGGAAWFTMSLWTGDGGSVPIDCRFVGSPKAHMVGSHRWLISGTVETRQAAATWFDYYRLVEQPSLDLNFITDSYSYFDGTGIRQVNDVFSELITFARASTADYYDSAGALQEATVNQPCIDHAPITGVRLGLRIRKADGARAQDRAVITGASLMKWAREDEGTLIVDVVTNVAATGQNQFFIHASNGTTSMRTALYQFSTGTSAYVTVTNTGVNSVAMSAGQYTVGQKLALGLAYKANDFFATANGGPGAADLSGPVAAMPARLDIGSRQDGANFVNDAHIRRIRFFPWRMSNTRLRELTA